MENSPSPTGRDEAERIRLQEKLTFQEQAIDELNAVVLSQQEQLLRLRGEMRALRVLVEEFQQQFEMDPLPEEKPPHY